MWRDGRLIATYKDGRAHLNAYLDDYALLIAALLELLQEEFRIEDLGLRPRSLPRCCSSSSRTRPMAGSFSPRAITKR